MKSLNPIESKVFVQKLINKDNGASEKIIEAYTGRLIKISFSLGFSDEDSLDLVQSTWLSFFESLPKFKFKSHIKTFLFGIFYNKVKELKREKIKTNKHDPVDSIFNNRFDDKGGWKRLIANPETFSEALETLNFIDMCLKELPLTQKTVFCLKIIEKESSKAICETLKISSSNLGVHLFRAKNKLRECIEIQMEV